MKNAIQKQDKDAYRALFNSNIQCKEQYLVPIAWHVIHDPQGRGNVSVTMLEDQVTVLNSKDVKLFTDHFAVFKTLLII